MAMLTVSRDVDAPAATVWAIITDLAGAPERLSSVIAVDVLEGPEFRVGTRWRETRTMFGRTATEEMTVSAVEPGRSYTTEADSHNAHYTSAMSVTPTGAGCRLTMTFEGQPHGFAARVMAVTLGWLLAGQTRKAMARDLDEIAAAAVRQP